MPSSGVVPLAYSPIGQGRLTGKYSVAHPPPGKRNFSNHPMATVETVLAALRTIGDKHGGKTPSQVALNWVMAKGAVPIPGAKSAIQALDNAGALGWRIDDDDRAVLDQAAAAGSADTGQPRLATRLRRAGGKEETVHTAVPSDGLR